MGKSTLLQALSARGCLAVDTDFDGWELPDALWDEPRIERLLATYPTVVVSGTAQNQGRFYDRFEYVVYVHVLAVLLERVVSRTNNAYGQAPSQQAEFAPYVKEVEPLIRLRATRELDGRLPTEELADVVEVLLQGR